MLAWSVSHNVSTMTGHAFREVQDVRFWAALYQLAVLVLRVVVAKQAQGRSMGQWKGWVGF